MKRGIKGHVGVTYRYTSGLPLFSGRGEYRSVVTLGRLSGVTAGRGRLFHEIELLSKTYLPNRCREGEHQLSAICIIYTDDDTTRLSGENQ